MTTMRRTAATAVLALVLPLPLLAAGTASASPSAPHHVTAAPAVHADPSAQPAALPRPTGPHAVGREILHLVDEHRTDPWVPSAGPRQLMVSMYYPAVPGTGGPAPYMTTDAARLLIQTKLSGSDAPPETLSGIRTWSHSGARPEHGRFPLVMLSPGFTMPRTELSGLAEDLASRGYVVALVDHTYENSGTTFPDGRTLPCAICDTPPPGGPAVIEESRAKDISFVIDELTGRGRPVWRYARMIDAARIGMAGHSIGGAATVTTMAGDPRVRAGVNLDGTMFSPVPADGLDHRPFLLVAHDTGGVDDRTWTSGWAALNGWKRWLTVAGSNHSSFTDVPFLADALGVSEPPGTTLTAQRSALITRAYVGAFFDLHLKGVPEPVLDGPTPAYPEVGFHS